MTDGQNILRHGHLWIIKDVEADSCFVDPTVYYPKDLEVLRRGLYQAMGIASESIV